MKVLNYKSAMLTMQVHVEVAFKLMVIITLSGVVLIVILFFIVSAILAVIVSAY